MGASSLDISHRTSVIAWRSGPRRFTRLACVLAFGSLGCRTATPVSEALVDSTLATPALPGAVDPDAHMPRPGFEQEPSSTP